MEKFLHALNSVPGVHYKALKRLWFAFQDWQFVWQKAGEKALLAAGVSENFVGELLKQRQSFDVDDAFAQLLKNGVTVLSRVHPEFPFLLKNIPDPPFVLYRRGAAFNWSSKHVAIVGTRKSTLYGEKIARILAEKITEQQGIVVSGLAFGIDAVAHFGAVSRQKPTIAVIASNVMNIMPKNHTGLAEQILRHGGTIVSEYAQDENFNKVRYHERNRIISGLCQATIVIEADIKSGALITAHKALEQGRDVYALPGDITRPQAQGCLRLIEEGAYPIIGIDDLISKLGFDSFAAKKLTLSTPENLILEQLKMKPCSSEDLFIQLRLPLEKLHVALSQLEIKGVIQKNKAFVWEAV